MTVREVLVSVLVIVIVAPGTTPPCGSVTVPCMVPRDSCATAKHVRHRLAARHKNAQIHIFRVIGKTSFIASAARSKTIVAPAVPFPRCFHTY
jgi:hypothetical protein